MAKARINLVPNTDTTISSRPVLVAFDDGSTPVLVDMIDPAATVDIPAGAANGTATPQGDVNLVGTGPTGVAFPFSTTPAPSVPVAAVVSSVDILT